MSAKIMRKFNEAINVATKSTMLDQHGAVVVRGGKTIGAACNSLQPIHNDRFGCWQHAEVAALARCCKQGVLRQKSYQRGEKQ